MTAPEQQDRRRRTDAADHERVQKAIDRATVEAARSAAWSAAVKVGGIVAFALLSLIIGVTVWQRSVTTRLDRQGRALVKANAESAAANARLDQSEMRACERLQRQRERSNVSDARQYLILRAVVTNPTSSLRVRKRFDVLARSTAYDPPTDCAEAVSHPNTYRRPESVPFGRLSAGEVEAIVQAAKAGRPQPVPGG